MDGWKKPGFCSLLLQQGSAGPFALGHQSHAEKGILPFTPSVGNSPALPPVIWWDVSPNHRRAERSETTGVCAV
jgi:hypothetical protein